MFRYIICASNFDAVIEAIGIIGVISNVVELCYNYCKTLQRRDEGTTGKLNKD